MLECVCVCRVSYSFFGGGGGGGITTRGGAPPDLKKTFSRCSVIESEAFWGY